MSIHIQARGFPLTKALKSVVQESILKVTERHHEVRTVAVRLEDINGNQHGGIDKSCRVVLNLDHAPSLVLQSTQSDMYLAIRHCAFRLKQTLNRNSERLKGKYTEH